MSEITRSLHQIQNTFIKFYLKDNANQKAEVSEINYMLRHWGLGDYIGLETNDPELSIEYDNYFHYNNSKLDKDESKLMCDIFHFNKYLTIPKIGSFEFYAVTFDYASLIMGYIYLLDQHRPFYYFPNQYLDIDTIADCISDYRYEIFGDDCSDKDMRDWIKLALKRYSNKVKTRNGRIIIENKASLDSLLFPEPNNKLFIKLKNRILKNVIAFSDRDF